MRKSNNQIFYFKSKNNNECDFIIKESLKVKMAIQVCYKLDDNNMERELNGLIEALNQFDLKEGLVLTYDQEDDLIKENKKIRILPLWKWQI